MVASPHPPAMVPYEGHDPGSSPEQASAEFYRIASSRRTVRYFSDRPVSRDTIANLVHAAGTAPSGANKQPWRFVCVDDPVIKKEIRVAAEAEEREFYERRASDRWLQDLHPFGTDAHKPFLERAPWLVVLFKMVKDDPDESGEHGQVYYVDESVGIAAGMFLTAVHRAGLATLTHTPSPMKFLTQILNRPPYERPFLLLPVGYPEPGCEVPQIERKPLDQILVFNR